MKIVDRYILRELLVPFLLGIAIFTSLLLIVRILKLVELVVNRGVPFLQILKLFSFILPAFLEVTLPMALLLAVLVAFGRLSSDSEITALRASGVSLYRLLVPVTWFALAAAVLTLGLSLWVRPWGNGLMRAGLYEIVKARVSAGLRPRIFNDEFQGLVLYVDRIEPPGNTLHGILISDRRKAARNTVYARSGRIFTHEDLHTLTLRLFDGGVHTVSEHRDEFQDTRFATYDISLDLDLALAELGRRPKDPSEMMLRELNAAIAARQAAGESPFAERVERHRKFTIPFACLVFAALAVPLGIQPSRSVHSRGFSVSLLLIVIYYLLQTLGENVGARGTFPAALVMWLPNGLLTLLAVPLLLRAAREPSHGGVPLLGRIRARIARRLLSPSP